MPYEECYTLLDEEGHLYQKHGSIVIPILGIRKGKMSQRC